MKKWRGVFFLLFVLDFATLMCHPDIDATGQISLVCFALINLFFTFLANMISEDTCH